MADLGKVSPEESPHALALGSDGHLYVGGYYKNSVWKVAPTGEISTLYPGSEKQNRIDEVLNLSFDDRGSLYILEWSYSPSPGVGRRFRILRLSAMDAEPSILFAATEGDDDFLNLHLGSMAVSKDGAIFISCGHRVWKLNTEGKLNPIAGASEPGYVNGLGKNARFSHPYGMALDGNGNIVVAEMSGRIRSVGTDGKVSTLAGAKDRGSQDGPGEKARFEVPFAVAVGSDRSVYVAEFVQEGQTRFYRIRVIRKGKVTTLATVDSKKPA